MYQKPKNQFDEVNLYIQELGENPDPEDIPTLVDLLWGGDKETSNNAAWALTRIQDPLAVAAIAYRYSYDDRLDRVFLAKHLKKMGAVAVKPLIEALKAEDPKVRYKAAYFLGEIGSEKAIRPLKKALKDEWGYVSHAAGVALRKCKTSSVNSKE